MQLIAQKNELFENFTTNDINAYDREIEVNESNETFV